MGDCILHRTHHWMSQACWGGVLGWYFDHPGDDQRNRYKAAYERALLEDVRRG